MRSKTIFINLKTNMVEVLCLLFLIVILNNHSTFAQQHPKVKLILKNGATIEGKNGSMDSKAITMIANNETKTYPLEDIQLIMVKKGRAGRWAGISGGGCAGICLVTIIAQSGNEEFETGELVAGSLIWIGIFSGAGYLIGNLADSWNIIYTAPSQSSILNRFKLGLGSRLLNGEFCIGLSYNF